jgi:hypothetical protein
MIDKFNQKYSGLDESQKRLLNKYITNVNDTAALKEYIENWSELLNIVYVKCDRGRGIISPNLNNALKYCNGEYIKILFQDDFLYDENSLQIVVDYINKKPIKWLLTGCTHTSDLINTSKNMVPFYHDRIYEGINTISSPSVLTIKNNDVLFFDETLHWLMDVEYYKRCYDKFGEPDIVSQICVVNREGNIVRATNLIDDETKQNEVKLMINRYK